ncbi:MAG: pantoate--beta-alanine ligase [Alphaproteobacteria bacterium]|nr:pantoate--beta-alanine ligase [Alphaproteobacteria bacterium]
MKAMQTVRNRKSKKLNTKHIEIVRDVSTLRAKVREWRQNGETIGLIPTMGALHDGHLALVKAAQRTCDRTVTSIFVNPTQFAPSEDFESYPRDEADDIAKLDSLSADIAFMPGVADMYADGFSTRVAVSGLSEGLCGASRPHFFGGVATVVTKLLLQALPDRAYFGEKDYQQLQVVSRMVRDLDIPSTIVGVPTVRESDGLAMSSRNWYLSPQERTVAPTLHNVLRDVAARVAGGEDCASAIAAGRAVLETAGFGPVDYIAVCHAESLEPLDRVDGPARVLAAAHLGRTRLIDNVPVK